jgi:ech hydrogenase subunit A
MQGSLLVLLTLLIPAVCAPLMLLLRRSALRKVVVSVMACAMIVVAVLLGINVLTQGHIIIKASTYPWVSSLVTIIDGVTLVVILFFGFRLREWKIILPSLLQAGAVIWLEVFKRPAEAGNLVNIDNLSLVLVLISSILGPLIAIFALGYMEKHEEHNKDGKSRQHIFFAVIFLFLFAMNALSITDNLSHLYAFWEITTLCSFLLIGYDRTRDALKSARRALWLNSLAGLFFVTGIVFIASVTNSVSISGLIEHGNAAGVLLAGVMFICCAGFVKSAQIPFQSWLLGAMVAPTPVSALLHSSTMVKAGVYIVVRLSPLFGGHTAGYMVSLVGAFTFMAASVLAMGQSNGKRVLAYSTISNLGLIIACAGLGGSAALSAAILLIIFHAVSKGLMFLCVGTVELGIGSRNIEDMFGIYSKMPFTTVIMVIGMISMVLPPFGVLITKWLALEAAVVFPPVLVLIVLGSAFTIVFWVKWLGAVLTIYKSERPKMEKLPLSIKIVLGVIGAFVPVLTALISPLNNIVVIPAVNSLIHESAGVVGNIGGIVVNGKNGTSGGFNGVLLLLGVIIVGLVIVYIIAKMNKPKIVPPYSGGELSTGDRNGRTFIGPMDKSVHMRSYNYYLPSLLGEPRLTIIAGFISVMLILIMFGVS